jgi:molybdopterin converting factor small subunit
VLERTGDLVAVEVRLPTLLRPAVGGNASLTLEGSTVGDVLRTLVEEHPGLVGQVLTEDGSLHRFVNVYVNDDDVRYLQSLDTTVGPSDELSILPAVAGGAVRPAPSP